MSRQAPPPIEHPDLADFYRKNPGFDLRNFDFGNRAAVDALSWDGLDKEKVLGLLKAFLRLLKLSPDVRVAQALLSPAPRRVALAMAETADAAPAATREPAPLDSAHAITGLSQGQFVEEYAPALGSGGADAAARVYQNAVHVQASTMHQWANLTQLSAPYARSLAVSNVSPEVLAHYESLPSYDQLFGTLNYCECAECQSIFGPAAYLVDLLRIANQYATTPNVATIPKGMKLNERRPDIALRPLTCENTNSTMPYLKVVNERLEEAVRGAMGIEGDLYLALALAQYPFELPFQLPLERIRIYLRRLKAPLAEVYEALPPAQEYTAAEYLNLSADEWQLLANPAADDGALKKFYGVSDLGQLPDLLTFRQQTNLKTKEVQDLLYQNLSPAEIADGRARNFFVNQGIPVPLNLVTQGEKEQIGGLAAAALDQVHRFLRLAAKLGWSFAELDWALHCANKGAPAMDKKSLAGLADLKRLCETFDAEPGQVCALLFDLKTYGVGDDPARSAAPFDRVFNGPGIAAYHPGDATGTAYALNPSYRDAPLQWTHGGDDHANLKLAGYVSAGLGLRQEDLVALATLLFGVATLLTVKNLSALYRHAQLASLLRLPAGQYVKFLQLFRKGSPELSAADLDEVAKQSDRLRRSGLNVFEMDYVVNGVVGPFVQTAYDAASSGAWLASLPDLLGSGGTPETAVQSAKLIEQLSAFLSAPSAQVKALLALLGQPDPSATFLDKSQSAAAAALIDRLSRLLLLARKLRLTNAEIDSIRLVPQAYGIGGVDKLTAANVLDIFRLKELRASNGDTKGQLLDYMSAPDDVAAKALAAVTGQPEEQLKQILALFGSPNRVERLDSVGRVADLIQRTGTDLNFLQNLKGLAGKAAADKWDAYSAAADGLLAAVRARLAGDREQLYLQLDGEEQERKRTALIRTAINSLSHKEGTEWVTSPRALYEYLLIDVEMSGCAQISYIKEALNAVQLYLLRCRERLEPGVADFAIPTVWWEWMMNYRVWEANRRIFLYPENYLDPAYRSSKTTLFKGLENQLKQNDISPQSVADAFNKYLDGFAELAKLKYVDAYYCNVSDDTRDDAPTLFMVARTDTQPYKYHYIVRESVGIWSEWQDVSVTINSDHVTPVYVFNRLFLFWVEQKRYDTKSAGNTNNVALKATVKYTFYNFSGRWVQPQTLAEDIVISVDNSNFRANFNDFLPASLFDAGRWDAVYPLKIERRRYWVPGAGGNKTEKLVVFLGPMLDVDAHAALTVNTTPTSTDATMRAFEDRLYKVILNFNQAKAEGHSCFLPVLGPVVVNDDLTVGFLVDPDEFLVLEKEAHGSKTYLRPEIDRSAGRLNLMRTNDILYDNYSADHPAVPAPAAPPVKLNANSFVSQEVGLAASGSAAIFQLLVSQGYINNDGTPAADLDFAALADDLKADLQGQPDAGRKADFVLGAVCRAAGTPWVSSSMRSKDYSLFTVKNHPTSFVFNGDKESILLLDPDRGVPSISRSLFNADTLLTPDAFVSPAVGIEAVGSKSIYQGLTDNGYLDDAGRLMSFTEASQLRKDVKQILAGQPGQPDKVDAVVNILMLSPIFRPDSFVAPAPVDIQAAGSTEIFKQLTDNGYLDKNGRLDAEIDFFELTGDVNTMLQGQPAQDKKVRFVVDTLYQHVFPRALGFFDDASARGRNLCEIKYEAVRLTTAAVHGLSAALFTGGIDALLSLSSQQIPVEPELPFARFQFSDSRVTPPEAIDGAQVDFSGAYGQYYWELFFHAPLFIAGLLKSNQQFRDAERWYQYIFNPTLPVSPLRPDAFVTSTLGATDSKRIYTALADQKIIVDGKVSPTFNRDAKLSRVLSFLSDKEQVTSVRNILLNNQLSSPLARFWQFQPFRNQTLESLHDQLSNPDEVARYNQNPFDPDAIARLRIGAYEKAVVMQYVDNLLQWGDSLFAQYTWESIVAATMLYAYAYNLLGERPEDMGAIEPPASKTFQDILNHSKSSGGIPQFLIELEQRQQGTAPVPMKFSPFNALDTYFCVPENENFIGYWDRVEDRLNKIRHCLNIQGIPQPLALFEPPIDPARLARAAAAGGDVLSRAASGAPQVPFYRFGYVLEKAKSFALTVSQLGASLLAALEKKDAEALAMLQATHESNILNLTTLVKEKQIEELNQSIASMRESQNSAQARADHYGSLYDGNLNALEKADLALRSTGVTLQVTAAMTRGITIAGYLSPNIFGLCDGGMQFGDAINAGAQMQEGIATTLDQSAALINSGAQYVRRREDWQLQRDTARSEVEQIKKQIDSNQARLDELRRELEIHQKSIEQEGAYEDFLKSRFTNEDLYQWMIGRLASVYFQTYRLALDMATAAQAAYQNETNLADQFLSFDYWDSLHRGLLAGESLTFALNQMEEAYTAKDARTLEIEKTISLLHLDPVKFVEFKTGANGAKVGELSFELSEKLFDFDFPGHYCRKIKAITVSVPAVVGPFQNINASLVQNSNAVVLNSTNADAVAYLLDRSRPRPAAGALRENWLPNQQIALSRGVNDAGLFVLDFRDERYLPFEGTGAVSKWTLSLPPETNRFDFAGISDIVVKVLYTAVDGGAEFAGKVKGLLRSDSPPYPYNVSKIFDLRQAFPREWWQFVNAPPQPDPRQLSFALADAAALPHTRNLSLLSATVVLTTQDGSQVSDKDAPFITLKLGDAAEKQVPISNNVGSVDLAAAPAVEQTCTLSLWAAKAPAGLLKDGALDPDVLSGITVVVAYQSNVFARAMAS
jgi:hypothetical protein